MLRDCWVGGNVHESMSLVMVVSLSWSDPGDVVGVFMRWMSLVMVASLR